MHKKTLQRCFRKKDKGLWGFREQSKGFIPADELVKLFISFKLPLLKELIKSRIKQHAMSCNNNLFHENALKPTF